MRVGFNLYKWLVGLLLRLRCSVVLEFSNAVRDFAGHSSES